MKKKYLQERKGVALVWVIFVFTILMILTTSTFYIINQNIFESAKQEERLQTYYIALAGVDLTYAAIMKINTDDTKIDPDIINKIGSKTLEEKIDIVTNGKKRGTATVRIDRVKEKLNEIEINWIRITSIGQMEGKEAQVSSTMRINEKKIGQIIRER